MTFEPAHDHHQIDFFISRRGEDSAHAREIAAHLTTAGYTVLSQDNDIRTGSNFLQKMHEFLKHGRDLIVILTPGYDRSPHTVLEFTSFIAAAMRAPDRRRLIIFRLVECDPQGLLAGFVYKDLVPIADPGQRRRVVLQAIRESDPLGPMDFGNFLQSKVDELRRQTVQIPADLRSGIMDLIRQYSGISGNGLPFMGRTDELNRLHAWLDEGDGQPYRLVLGPGGRGKSSLLVRWMLELASRPDLDIIFFPVSIRYGTNTANAVLLSLASQLTQLHGNTTPQLFGTPAEAVRNMIHHHLGQNTPSGKITLLILDGLDEASDKEIFRGLFPSEPASHVRVLLSARPFPDDEKGFTWLERLGMSPASSSGRRSKVTVTHLQRLTEPEIKTTVQNALAGRVDPNGLDEIATQLIRLTSGEPFVLVLYLDQLLEAGTVDAGLVLTRLAGVEPGLYAYFKQWWQQQESLWESANVAIEKGLVVLRVLAMAQGPMTMDEIQAVAGDAIPAYSVREALGKLHRFIVTTKAGKRFTLFHDKFVEFVRQELMSERERQVHLNRFIDWGLSEVEVAVPSPQGTSHAIPEYLVRHLGIHLAAAESRMSQAAVLLDRPWADAWYKLEGNHSGYLTDVERIFRWAGARFVGSSDPRQQEQLFLMITRVLLVRSSVISAAESIPKQLLYLLVSEGVWNSTQALSYIGVLDKDGRRTAALVAISQVVDVENADWYIDLALTSPDIQHILDALKAIGPRLPASAIPGFLRATKVFRDPYDRAMAIKSLGAQAHPALKEEILAILTAAIGDSKAAYQRCAVTFAMAGYVDPAARPAMLERAIREARATDWDEGPTEGLGDAYKTEALCELARAVGDPVMERVLCREALDILRLSQVEPRTPTQFKQLAPWFADSIFGEALEYAWRLDRTFEYETNAVIYLIAHLDLDKFPTYARQLEEELTKAIDQAGTRESREHCFDILLLEKKLTGPFLDKFTASLDRIGDTEIRLRCQLIRVKDLVGVEQALAADQLYKECFRQPHSSWKAEILSSAARYMEKGKRAATAIAILDLAQSINDGHRVTEELLTFSSRCNREEIQSLSDEFLLTRLYPALTNYWIAKERGKVQLVALLSDHQRQTLLTHIRVSRESSSSDLLELLSPYVGKSFRKEEYLATVAAIGYTPTLFVAATSLLDRVASPKDRAEMEVIFLTLCEDDDLYEAFGRNLRYKIGNAQMEFFAGLFPRLRTAYQRFRTGVWAFPILTDPQQRKSVLGELSAALQQSDGRTRTDTGLIEYLAKHLTVSELTVLLDTAWPLLDPTDRCFWVTAIFPAATPQLREQLLQQFFKEFREIPCPGLRGEVPDNDLPDALVYLLGLDPLPSWVADEVFEILADDPFEDIDLFMILKAVARMLDETQVMRYVAIALDVLSPGDRIDLIEPVLFRLPEDLRAELMADLQVWIKTEDVGLDGLMAFVSIYDRLPGADLAEVAKTALAALGDDPGMDAVPRFLAFVMRWVRRGSLSDKEMRQLLKEMFGKWGFAGRGVLLNFMNGLGNSAYLQPGDHKFFIIAGQLVRTVEDWP